MSEIALYFHTVRHLRPIQVRYQIARRALPVLGLHGLNPAPRLRAGIDPISSPGPAPGSVSADLAFNFLNSPHAAAHGRIDWIAAGMSKLWRYNLHYFDWLRDGALSARSRAEVLSDWVRCNPIGTADAWEPYPVSLRIVNWIKYFLSAREQVTPQLLESLYAQSAWLERRLEYHLLGNHLLKNAVALLFAGAYFSGAAADRWLQRGWRLVREQAREQFLADGGHFERSPMYHSIALLDCLDSLAIVRQLPDAVEPGSASELAEVALHASQFLRDLCLPDGEIPLFNDSAMGIAPPPAVVLERAAVVLGHARLDREPAPLISKSANGYFGFRSRRDMLVVDCGELGPDYQPGHAHCDTLSYVLALDGARVIVDSGVYEYAPGARRQLCRTTAGHNTVMLDGAEQSEIWGAFRVARRARPIVASARHVPGGGWRFEGSHDGYRRLSGRPVHRRRISREPTGRIEVADEIAGSGRHSAVSRIRVHPDYRIVINGCYARILSRDGQPIARIEPFGADRIDVEAGEYFPQFGRALEIDVLALRIAGLAPLRFGYRIVKESPS